MEPSKQLLTPLTNFKEQFSFVPEIINRKRLTTHKHILICGMGGSALSASLLKLFFPELFITLHNSYGLPQSYDKDNTLIIINSYSGNTEEELESFERAVKEGASLCALSLGGKLLEKIKEYGGAYVQLPLSSLEPRFSIGHQMIGLLSLMGEDDKIQMLHEKTKNLDTLKLELAGKKLADEFSGLYPVLYASENLYPVAYLIKAALNEGAKVPAFVSKVPEANHNELQSFVTNDTITVSKAFGVLLLQSSYDHVRIVKRFSIMKTMYTEQNFTVTHSVTDHTNITAIFELIITGYYMATFMAIAKDVDPYTTPFIGEFKKRLTE